MLRRRANDLLALSAAILVAAVIGVQLGHSAIGEINPIHFQGAAPPPQGIDPGALRPAENAFAQAYGWGQGHAARDYECGGNCDAREVRQAAAAAIEPIRVEPAGGPYWRDATPIEEPKPWAPGETGHGSLSVERYMRYPVEEAPAEAEPVAGPAAPEEAKLAAADEEPGGE